MGKSSSEMNQTSALIHNIGILVSGDIENPILEDDALLVKGGLIDRIGSYEELEKQGVDLDIDIQGMTLCPGLVDTHTHPNIGDWVPRTKIFGWMDSSVHAGVTTLISQGEILVPGKPTDAAGVKALAILAKKVFDNYRPGGVKAHCGALVLEEGLTGDDIRELAREGVWLFAEIGLGGLRDFDKVNLLVQAARKYGFKIPMHFGPESVPGTKGGLSTDEIIKINPDVVVHFNGGPTSCSLSEMKKLAENCSSFLELITSGNDRAIGHAITLLRERGEFSRIILGTDSPSAAGFETVGMLRLISRISSLSEVPGAIVLAMATGNAAIAYGLNRGVVKPGREADLIVIDAPIGSQGNTALEAIEVGDRVNLGMVMIDGKIITRVPKRALPTGKKVLVNGEEDPTNRADIIDIV